MNHVDVLVVGGGLIGCATAWHLAREGATVRVVEAGDIGMGASGQNAGSLHFQLERRFLEHGDALAAQAAPIAALNRLAVADWAGLQDLLGPDIHVVMDGGLMVAETADEVALLERKIARENDEGLRSRLIDGDEVRTIAPYLASTVLAAGYSPDEGHVDARVVTTALAEAARGAGASIVTGSPVREISRRSGKFWIESDGDAVSADRVLLAAGAWSARVAAMLNLHIPLFPVALLMNATERSAIAVPHLIQHVGRRLSLKQTGSGNLLIGGGWPSRMQANDAGEFVLSKRPEIVPASLSGNMRAAVDVVPHVAQLNLIRSWTGVTAISADQLPIVGEVPAMPGCWVAGGGSALTLGPTFARLISRAMAGAKVSELDIVSPSRFDHLNSFMG